jgi:hypothetical protein
MNQDLVFPKTFPNSMAAIAGHGQEKRIQRHFEESIPVIQAALAAGEILSTSLNDVKYDVNHIIEDVIKLAINEKYTYGGKWESLPSDLYELNTPYSARELNAFIKRLNKLSPESKKHPMYEDATKIAMELFPFYQFMEWTKTHTVKASERRKAAAEAKATEKAEYNKKLVEHEDMKKVIDLLKGTAQDIKQRLFESRRQVLMYTVEKFKASVKAGESDIAKVFERDPMGMNLISKCVERTDKNVSFASVRTYRLKSLFQKVVEEQAMKEAEDILNHFVYKNSNKLSIILTTKNNLKSVEIKNIILSKGVIECDVYCVFKDGSEFTANNKVVFSYSKYGTPFYRFPTTFRNVILPNGEKMSQPSEERMDMIFAVAK